MNNQVYKVLKKIGISVGLDGFDMLEEAIDYVLSTNTTEILNQIFPHVARVFEKTTWQVQQNIRNAIEKSFFVSEENIPAQIEVFGGTYSGKSGCPTPKEFIIGVARYIQHGGE